MEQEKQTLTAAEYFDKVKELKNKTTDEGLNKFYDASLLMLNKFSKTGQKKMVNKTMFIIDTITKERELVKKGINVFVYKEDIENFIDKVQNKEVKIIEMKDFPRDIPDELVDIIDDTKDIFNKFYILFTDYTGKEERKVAKERREKDPILFGTFISNRNDLYERFYYLGDWVDDYCDLTLEKFLEIQGEEAAKTITTPINKEELLLEYNRLKETKSQRGDGDTITWTVASNTVDLTDVSVVNGSNKDDRIVKKDQGLISKVKTYFTRGKK